MFYETIFLIASIFLGLLGTHSVQAEQCAAKTNMTINPSQQVKAVAAGWLQWLNRSYQFTCSGNSSQLTCSHGSESYTFVYSCNGSTCHVDTYDSAGWRNEAVLSSGQAWNWTWDGTVNGYTTQKCVVDTNHLGNPCIMTYGTCD